jgi:heat-inducible transcriptional repressor
MSLNERQILLLKSIVDEYTSTALPISSEIMIKKYFRDYSSATIRNEMSALEKENYIEKTHTSSGRIPTIKGYKFYESNILKNKLEKNIKLKLKRIFSQRDVSIDTILDQSTEIITNSLKLPSVVTSINKSELLKRFDFIQIDNKNALIIIVTSSGNINKANIVLNNKKELEDISICVRIFNDRLIDTPLTEINNKIESLKEIIRNSVHEYEYCMQQLIKKIFKFNENPMSISKVSGTK